MAFNRASFEYISGGARGSIWRAIVSDNLSTANVGDRMDNRQSAPVHGCQDHPWNFWGDAYTYFGLRPYDVIFCINGSSPHCGIWVVEAADSNGVSVINCNGAINHQ